MTIYSVFQKSQTMRGFWLFGKIWKNHKEGKLLLALPVSNFGMFNPG
jgi:hypothetical protein